MLSCNPSSWTQILELITGSSVGYSRDYTKITSARTFSTLLLLADSLLFASGFKSLDVFLPCCFKFILKIESWKQTKMLNCKIKFITDQYSESIMRELCCKRSVFVGGSGWFRWLSSDNRFVVKRLLLNKYQCSFVVRLSFRFEFHPALKDKIHFRSQKCKICKTTRRPLNLKLCNCGNTNLLLWTTIECR